MKHKITHDKTKRRFCVTLRSQNTRIYRKFFTTKKKAQEHIDEELNTFSNGLLTPKYSGNHCGITPAIEEYLQDCEKRNMRRATIKTYGQRLNQFNQFIGNTLVEKIERHDVKSFAEKENNTHTRSGYRNDVASFLNWCGEKGWCPQDKFHGIKLGKIFVDEKEIPILSVEKTQEILNHIPSQHKLRVCLQLFAGLRPYEACRELTFSDDKIIISGSSAKGRRTRTLSGLPCNLKVWLQNFKVKPCTYNSFRLARDRHCGALGHDAMRHSFCSYGFWVLGQEKCMRFTGHTNHRTFHHNYCESNVSESEAKEYFSITPV
jgi:integrase